MSTRPIKPGEAVRLSWNRPEQADYLAGLPCSDTAPGRWYCATHPDADVHNNLAMSLHCDELGSHVEVWVCVEHGPEAPTVVVAADGSIG